MLHKHWQGWINWYLRKVIIRGFVSFTCLFSGYCLKFGVLVPGWNLLLLGHLSWLFLATPQPKLSSAVDWSISSTVVLKIVYLLASKQSLDQLYLNNACCLFPAFMDLSWRQPALLSGTWGLPGKPLHSWELYERLHASLSVAQSALFLSRKKMGKLEALPLNLGPNSISSFGCWKALPVSVPCRNHWEEWTVSRWLAWIWGFT